MGGKLRHAGMLTVPYTCSTHISTAQTCRERFQKPPARLLPRRQRCATRHDACYCG